MTDELAKALRIFADPASWRHNGPLDANSGSFRGTEIAAAALTAYEAHAKATPSERETGWLIERKYPTNTIGATEPRWYAERVNGDHWWTPVPNDAKRFSSKKEAEAYPAYKMIAGDPTINITEHMWINDGFSWSHGQVSEERGVIICPDCRGERRGANGLLCSRCGGTAQIRRQSLRADEAAPFEADEISKAPSSEAEKTLAELDARYAAGDLDQIGSMWGFVRSHIASLVKERDDARALAEQGNRIYTMLMLCGEREIENARDSSLVMQVRALIDGCIKGRQETRAAQAEAARMREALKDARTYLVAQFNDGAIEGHLSGELILEIDDALNPETPAGAPAALASLPAPAEFKRNLTADERRSLSRALIASTSPALTGDEASQMIDRLIEAAVDYEKAEGFYRRSARSELSEARYALLSRLECGEREGWRPTHRHKKRGTEYAVVGQATIQVDGELTDEEEVIVYKGRGGRLWVRRVSEFNDGRFEPLPAAPVEEPTP